MKRFLTEAEINYIRERFADTPTAEIASTLGFHYQTVCNKAYSMGLKKSEDFLRSEKCGRLIPGSGIGANSRFKKGQEAWNKGKKLGKEWTKGRMAETQFKAGRLPHNTRENDGALSKRQGYWYIRISLGKWRQLHTHTWEKANRPINPKTEMVKFKDGNRDNCNIENLYLATRSENMTHNTIHNYPPEIKDGIRAITSLKRTIKRHEKQH